MHILYESRLMDSKYLQVKKKPKGSVSLKSLLETPCKRTIYFYGNFHMPALKIALTASGLGRFFQTSAP